MKIEEYQRFTMRAGIVLPSIVMLIVVNVSVRGEEPPFQNNERDLMDEGRDILLIQKS